MDMTVIDTVQASTLEVGDSIEFYDDDDNVRETYGVQSIKSIDDSGDYILVVSEDDDEMWFDPYVDVDVWGYEDGDDSGE